MMNMVQACSVVAQNRPQDSILVATMGAMFLFDRIEAEAAQANVVPTGAGPAGVKAKASRVSSVPLMGGAAGLGLGLAMAQTKRKVIVVDGDSSLLMELSGLVTVATQRPRNYVHVVIHNGTQFTGLANLKAVTSTFNFAEAARNAGYVHSEVIADGTVWAQRFPDLLAMDGPVFVELQVDPVPARAKEGFVQDEMPDLQFERMGIEAAALREALTGGVTA